MNKQEEKTGTAKTLEVASIGKRVKKLYTSYAPLRSCG